MHLFPCRPAVQTASQRTISQNLKLSKLFTCVSGAHRAHQHTSRGLTLHLNFFPSLILLYAMLLSLSVVAYVCVLLLCCAITAGLLAPSTGGPHVNSHPLLRLHSHHKPNPIVTPTSIGGWLAHIN